MDGPNTQKGTKEGFQGALDLFILFDAFVKTNSYSKICYIIYHFFGFVNPLFLLFNVLVVIPDAISQCIFTAARRNVPAS